MAATASTVRVNARSPAPPVSTSVPSMSKRTRLCISEVAAIYNPARRNRMNARNLIIAAGAVALAGSALLAQEPKPQTVMKARAEIKGDGISGTVEFEERLRGTTRTVMITLKATGLKPGLHGVHLHAIGKCEPPGFTAAGGHFDPGPAGNTDPDANHPFHMGDIPNLEIGKDGSGSLESITTRVTLSDGPLSLFDADGTAIIIHANPDQGITGAPKSGVSGGPRVACGAVTK
jgi:Cu-Zn family superoxide dismutase